MSTTPEAPGASTISAAEREERVDAALRTAVSSVIDDLPHHSGLHSDKIDFAIRQIAPTLLRAPVAPAPIEPGEGEQVAWRYRYGGEEHGGPDTTWTYCEKENLFADTIEQWRHRGWVIEPLYAAIPKPAPAHNCYECGAALIGPLCPDCNVGMVIGATAPAPSATVPVSREFLERVGLMLKIEGLTDPAAEIDRILGARG